MALGDLHEFNSSLIYLASFKMSTIILYVQICQTRSKVHCSHRLRMFEHLVVFGEAVETSEGKA